MYMYKYTTEVATVCERYVWKTENVELVSNFTI